MRHMIYWLKICAFLLGINLFLHSLEILYDIVYHMERGTLFEKHEAGNFTEHHD